MKNILKVIMVFVCMCSMGCTTLMYENRNRAIRERAEADEMKLTVDKLERQIEGMVTTQEDLNRRVDELSASRDKDGREFKEGLAEVKQLVKGIQAAQVKMRKEIIGDLSGKMSDIMSTQQPPVGSSEVGRWHIVESGQTLSEIARAYRVTISAIVKGNDFLKTEDTIIKVGQKVFIPE